MSTRGGLALSAVESVLKQLPKLYAVHDGAFLRARKSEGARALKDRARTRDCIILELVDKRLRRDFFLLFFVDTVWVVQLWGPWVQHLDSLARGGVSAVQRLTLAFQIPAVLNY